MLYRLATVNRDAMDAEKRTLPLTFSSEEPYQRWYGREILGHKPGEVLMDRINAKAPLLADHDHTKQIGVVEKASLDGTKGSAVVRFSQNPGPQEVLADILDGIKGNVSVGYVIHELEDVTPPPDSDIDEGDDGPIKGFSTDDDGDFDGDSSRVYRATKWEPYEISMVSMPADTTVGVGRSARPSLQTKDGKPIARFECRIVDNSQDNRMKQDNPTVTVTNEETRKKAAADEKSRVKEILALGREFKMEEAADKYIADDHSIDQFRDFVLRELAKKPKDLIHAGSSVGRVEMPIREASRYRVTKAILQSTSQRRGTGRLDGIEAELSQEISGKVGRQPDGFFIPDFAFAPPLSPAKRDLATLTQAGGAFTVESTVLGTELVELYRKKTYVMKAGARYLGGLQGNVLIPRQTGPGTIYWLAENAQVTEADQGFGQFSLNPHTAMAQTAYSKQFIAQSSIDVEGFVRNDINRILAIAQDYSALSGTGNSGQPTGVANYNANSWSATQTYSSGSANVTTIAFGATATFVKVVSMETAIAMQDADVDNMAYITSPAVRGAWKGIPKGAVTTSGAAIPIFIWDGDKGPDAGMVNGYRAFATNQLGSGTTVANQVMFGNWGDLIIANWAGIDVVTDPYTKAGTGEIVVTIHCMLDVGLRHPPSFCISTDSGAQ